MSEKEVVVVKKALLRILGADKDGKLSTARVDTVAFYCPECGIRMRLRSKTQRSFQSLNGQQFSCLKCHAMFRTAV
jgi:predicted RNA-binding Zn-ribbon protein involved in translation (DUF1610 family)